MGNIDCPKELKSKLLHCYAEMGGFSEAYVQRKFKVSYRLAKQMCDWLRTTKIDIENNSKMCIDDK